MAVKHSTPADGTFSAAGQSAWDAAHDVEDASIEPQHLDRVYSVPADLVALQQTSSLSSAAFRASSFFAQSTAVATVGVTGAYSDLSGLPDLDLYQLSSQISSAAFTVSTDYAGSSHSHSLLSLTGYSGGATTFLSGISTFTRPDVRLLAGYSGGATTFLSGISTFALPSVLQLGGYSGGSTAYLSGQSTFQVPNITTLTGFTGNTAHFLRGDSTFAAPSGGSDPWTILSVSASHFGTSSVAFRDIPGLSFIPGTNSSYMIEGMLMMKTSTAAVVPKMRIRWPTGTSSAGWINIGHVQSTVQQWFGNEISTLNNSSTGVMGTTTAAWPYFFGATIRALGGAASSFGLMLATGSTTVFVSTMIGGYLRYRTF